MSHRSIAVASVLTVILVASVYLGVRGRAPQGRPDRVEPRVSAVVRAVSAGGETRPAADSGPSREEAAATEIRNTSLTFRNGTFLIAIRRAGFYCDDVVAAHESVDGVWVASCADRSGYTLSVRDVNEFDVLPIRHYFDGLAPSPSPRLRDDPQRLDR